MAHPKKPHQSKKDMMMKKEHRMEEKKDGKKMMHKKGKRDCPGRNAMPLAKKK